MQLVLSVSPSAFMSVHSLICVIIQSGDFLCVSVGLYPNELTGNLSRIFVNDGGNWWMVTIIVHEVSR